MNARVGQKEVKREPTGAQREPNGAERLIKVSQRVTEIIKKSIFGKNNEKGAEMIRKSHEI